jgi:hypothetical protein
VLLVLAASVVPVRASDPARAAVAAARRAGDDAALAALQTRLRTRALERPEDFEAQMEAVEVYLARADGLRLERKLADLPGDVDDAHRAQQAAWADEALPLARRAEALASDDAQRARVERALGELHAHKITGMMSGMWNGPRARGHLGRALELAPDDPESQRAIGLMYLFNPPISGGDVPRAIETFQACSEALPEDDRCPVLLGMAYRKHEEPGMARTAAREALRRNPGSRSARLLLEAVGGEAPPEPMDAPAGGDVQEAGGSGVE